VQARYSQGHYNLDLVDCRKKQKMVRYLYKIKRPAGERTGRLHARFKLLAPIEPCRFQHGNLDIIHIVYNYTRVGQERENDAGACANVCVTTGDHWIDAWAILFFRGSRRRGLFMSDSGKVMKRKNPYMVVDVTPFRDTRLSWKAKGLMTYFLDKPENWTFYLEHIFNQAPDGEKAVRSGIKELMKFGYIVRVAFRDGRKVAKWEFLVYEQPVKFPSEKPIHVNLSDWQNHLEEGGDIDITLFAQNRKVEKKRAKSLLAQNLQVENLQVEKLHVGNAGLLNTNNTNQLYSAINKDDDAACMKDYKYLAFRELFTQAGAADIKRHDLHYQKFLDLLSQIGFGKLTEYAEKYIEKEGSKAEIVWFLSDGWRNYMNAANSKNVDQLEKKTVADPLSAKKNELNILRSALAAQMNSDSPNLLNIKYLERQIEKVESEIDELERARQEVAATAEPKQMTDEELAEKQANIRKKLLMMREQQKKEWREETNA
jgi:hypothetical protein